MLEDRITFELNSLLFLCFVLLVLRTVFTCKRLQSKRGNNIPRKITFSGNQKKVGSQRKSLRSICNRLHSAATTHSHTARFSDFSTLMANRKKVVTSAIIVSPPQEMWSSIQAIRSKHDKSYVRWMPHINLIYPFVPANEFANIVGPLTQGLSSLQPFNLTFDSFDFFEHGARSCTLFLKPRTDV